jgi:hypothetical protein
MNLGFAASSSSAFRLRNKAPRSGGSRLDISLSVMILKSGSCKEGAKSRVEEYGVPVSLYR